MMNTDCPTDKQALLFLFDKSINYIFYVLLKQKSPFSVAGQIKNFFTPERIFNQINKLILIKSCGNVV